MKHNERIEAFKDLTKIEESWMIKKAIYWTGLIVGCVWAIGNLFWFGLIFGRVHETLINSNGIFFLWTFAMNVIISIGLITTMVIKVKINKPDCLTKLKQK